MGLYARQSLLELKVQISKSENIFCSQMNFLSLTSGRWCTNGQAFIGTPPESDFSMLPVSLLYDIRVIMYLSSAYLLVCVMVIGCLCFELGAKLFCCYIDMTWVNCDNIDWLQLWTNRNARRMSWWSFGSVSKIAETVVYSEKKTDLLVAEVPSCQSFLVTALVHVNVLSCVSNVQNCFVLLSFEEDYITVYNRILFTTHTYTLLVLESQN